MADSAYSVLIDNVKSIQSQIEEKTKELQSLQSDGNYFYYKSRLDKVPKDGNTWIDGSGQIWSGADAHKGYLEGVEYVSTQESKIDSVQKQLAQLKIDLIDAQERVTKYQKDSPTYKQEADQENIKTLIQAKLTDAALKAKEAAQKNSTVIAIAVFLFLLAVGTIAVIKNKKQKTV